MTHGWLTRAGRARLDRRAALAVVAGAIAAGRVRPRLAAQEEPGWETLPELPVARSEMAAAVSDGAIYVVGGFGGGSRLDRFDPAGAVWEHLADLPVALNHPGVAALDGILYVAGGYGGTFDVVGACWAYDPAADAWEERAPLPEARGALGLVALDGRLYAVGGARDALGGPVSGAVEAYDPATDGWMPVTTMPTPREHLAVAAGDGLIWTAGGRANGDDRPSIAGVAEVYDPASDTWTTLPPLPTPRGGVAGAWVAGRFVTLGGETFSGAGGPHTHDEVEAFDPATDTWSALPPLPTPRHGLAAAAVGETLYAISGSTVAGQADNTPAVEALTFAPETA